MAVVLKPFRSNTAGAVPTTANLADGEMAINSADRKIYLRAGTSILEVANVSGLDNMLINCGIPINQRGFAGGALAAGAYGYDRWKAGTGGCNVTINATTGLFTHTSGPLQQIIESPELAWGQPLTLSVENPNGTITVSVGGTTGTITAGSGRRGVTITPTGSGNMTVQLTATGVTYSRPKLERGSTASTYIPRPLAQELLLCQRYAYVFRFPEGPAHSIVMRLGSTGILGWLDAFCDMRAVPAASFLSGQIAFSDAVPLSSPSLTPVSVRRVAFQGNVASGTPNTVSYVTGVVGNPAVILFDAEL